MPEDPAIIFIMIVLVTLISIGIAAFSLEYGIFDLYPYLFLLPIIMTAYFFPRYGVYASAGIGLLLTVLTIVIAGIQVPAITRALITGIVFMGIGGIITILSQDIAGLKQRYENIFTLSETGIIVFDSVTGKITDANRGFLVPLGYTGITKEHFSFEDFFAKQDQYRELVRDVKDKKRITGRTIELVPPSGSSGFFQVSACAFGHSRILCTFVDVTERRLYVESLHRSLAEKETLIKEVHHRVKNNMQVILSLLDLNALQADNEREKAKYTEMQGRVMTMALIHEKLYQSPISGFIEAETYFTELLKNIISASAMPGVSCTVSAPQVYLDIDKAIPCGLIVNELATNSLKYAFKTQDKARIQLSLVTGNTGSCLLDFSDNGRGLLATDTTPSPETLGSRLIKMLVRQLKGTMTITSHGGTHYFIRFPLSPQEIGINASEGQNRIQTDFSRWS